MGTYLITISNHNIKFANRSYKELTNEITNTLNNIQFANAKYLKHQALIGESCSKVNVRKVKEILTKDAWTYQEENPEFFTFSEDNYINLYGPFSLKITITPYYIYFDNPTILYWHWINHNDFFENDEEIIAFRNEWRKYFYQVVKAFGGNRVIYLADNSHPLDGYADRDDTPFEEIEREIIEKLGEPVKTFHELADNPRSKFMIDYLDNIDWDSNIQIEENVTYPSFKSDTNFELSDYATIEQLRQVKWDFEFYKCKTIEGIVHFVHLTQYKGIYVEQKGIVCGEHTIQLHIDEYAPFKFDEQEKYFASIGYNEDLTDFYCIIFASLDDYHSWKKVLDIFESSLPWTGNGNLSGEISGEEGVKLFLWVVDVNQAIELLLSIEVNNRVKAPIEIAIFDEEKNKTIIFQRG